jgi:hypothetical protein
VVTLLQKYNWRVSEDGLEKYGRSFGFDCLWESTTHNGRQTRTLVICGKLLQLEIAFENHVVVAVKLEFPMSSPLVRDCEARAGEILYKDLSLPFWQSPLTKKLDKFAANFERLAALDKFSFLPHLDFLGALVGMHRSLAKLYRWDIARKRQDARYSGQSEDMIAKVVVCQEHGRPALNEDGKVGLALHYWTEKQFHPTHEDQAAPTPRSWFMHISCSPFGDVFYPPVRFTSDWISDAVEVFNIAPISSSQNTVFLDWRDPPHNPLDSSIAANGTSIMRPDGSLSLEKYPNAMFVANFDPPIVLPQGVSQRLHALLGVSATAMWSTYESLVLPAPHGEIHGPGDLRQEAITRYMEVLPPLRESPSGASAEANPVPTIETTVCTVHIARGVYAHRLSHVPFAHPRQLVEMMPILRQYAFLATVLENSFGTSITGPLSALEQLDAEAESGGAPLSHGKPTQEALARRAARSSEPSQKWSYDVTINVYPSPQIQVVFPMPSGELAIVMFEIRANGVPHIIDQNVLANDETGHPGVAAKSMFNGKPMTVARLTRYLAVGEHLGMFCSWVRTRLG